MRWWSTTSRGGTGETGGGKGTSTGKKVGCTYKEFIDCKSTGFWELQILL